MPETQRSKINLINYNVCDAGQCCAECKNETRHTSAKRNVINGLLRFSNEQFLVAKNGHAEKEMMCGR